MGSYIQDIKGKVAGTNKEGMIKETAVHIDHTMQGRKEFNNVLDLVFLQ